MKFLLSNIKITGTENALRHRFPEPLCLIISKDKKGKINLCPVGNFTLVTWKPKIWAIALYKTHHTTKVISETNEFALCLPAIGQVNDVLYCSSVHGWNIDKTKNIKLKLIKSSKIKPPLIDNSIACFECKVIGKQLVKDQMIFFGEIVTSYTSGKNWQKKIYNWDDKTLGTIKLGIQSKKIKYSPQGE